jgi:molecular chaperone GrpE
MGGKSKLKSKPVKREEIQVNELKEQLIRALADYDNLRKRTETEIEDKARLVKARLVLKLLSVFDMLKEAQEHLKDSGLAITLREFEDVLTEEGLEKIEVEKGTKFDEELHEAVEIVEPQKGKIKSETIAEELLSGWKFTDGPIIRPSKVRVYKR